MSASKPQRVMYHDPKTGKLISKAEAESRGIQPTVVGGGAEDKEGSTARRASGGVPASASAAAAAPSSAPFQASMLGATATTMGGQPGQTRSSSGRAYDSAGWAQFAGGMASLDPSIADIQSAFAAINLAAEQPQRPRDAINTDHEYAQVQAKASVLLENLRRYTDADASGHLHIRSGLPADARAGLEPWVKQYHKMVDDMEEYRDYKAAEEQRRRPQNASDLEEQTRAQEERHAAFDFLFSRPSASASAPAASAPSAPSVSVGTHPATAGAGADAAPGRFPLVKVDDEKHVPLFAPADLQPAIEKLLYAIHAYPGYKKGETINAVMKQLVAETCFGFKPCVCGRGKPQVVCTNCSCVVNGWGCRLGQCGCKSKAGMQCANKDLSKIDRTPAGEPHGQLAGDHRHPKE